MADGKEQNMTATNDKNNLIGDRAPTPFRGTYDEAFDLLIEARNYVEHHVPAFKYADNPPDRTVMTKETLRLTSRLTQVMAWLMAQRAVHEGEIGEADFTEEKYRLEAHEVCLKRAIEDLDDLPDALNDLMARSYDLYNRIMRLDEKYLGPAKSN